jgi:hypothetical protein
VDEALRTQADFFRQFTLGGLFEALALVYAGGVRRVFTAPAVGALAMMATATGFTAG